MSDFRKFDQVKTAELLITRHKWFWPYYQLTDGQFVYGKLSYKSQWRRYAVIETADGSWTIKRKGWFSRTLILNRDEDEQVGTIIPELWKRNIAVKFDSGFEATFVYKKLFARSFILTNDMFGDILQVQPQIFGVKTPFKIVIEQPVQKNLPNVPLLVLIGVNLILLRQAQAAAAASA